MSATTGVRYASLVLKYMQTLQRFAAAVPALLPLPYAFYVRPCNTKNPRLYRRGFLFGLL